MYDELKAHIVRLFERCRRVDFREHETLSLEQNQTLLVPTTLSLVKDVHALASTLTSSTPRERPGEHTRFELELDASDELADIAFLVRLDLGPRRETLAQVFSSSEELLACCDGGLRHAEKALRAMARVLSKTHGAKLDITYESELEIGLETRRRYKQLWVLARKWDGAVDVRAAIRSAGTMIAILIGKSVYSKLRHQDRWQLRNLQRRILKWLNEPLPIEGRRLWSDFASYVEMLRAVSNRQELVEHDQDLLRRLARNEPVDARAIEGFDDSLDAALAGDPQEARRVAQSLLAHKGWERSAPRSN